MKVWLRCLLAASTIAVIVGGSALTASAVEKRLTVHVYAQSKSQWCWVAATQMVIWRYKGADDVPVQCAVYKSGKGTSTCPNSPGTFGDVANALINAGIDAGAVSNSALSFTAIRGEIDVGRIALARWGWKSTDLSTGHMLVVRGYNTAGSLITYNNPADGGSTDTVSYSSFADNAAHKWTHSRYYIMD